MSRIRLESVDGLGGRPLGSSVAHVLARAEAMGLLPDGNDITRLDWPVVAKTLNKLLESGIAREAISGILRIPEEGGRVIPSVEWDGLFRRIYEAMGSSPTPEMEWPALLRVFSPEGLVDLLGISVVSLRRYESGSRSTPDDVAQKLHFLALVVEDLAGAYNERGIRSWFDRPRSALKGKSPRQALGRQWSSFDGAALSIRHLAKSLASSPAT